MISLSDTVKLFAEDAKKTLEKVVPAVRVKVAESLINKTPLDTGEARGEWQSTIGSPATGKNGRLDRSAGFAPTSGPGSSLREAEEVARQDVENDFYIVNNADHIVKLEYGGSKRQAPNGMQRLTVADFPAMVGEAVRETK
jgi:hypothetical protein